MDIRLFLAVATLVGSIVGVGIFGIPYVISQVGFLPGIFYLFLLGSVSLLLHLLFSEVILRTKKDYRLPGYANFYLGNWAKYVVLFSTIVGISSSLICYIIAGGEFLSTIFKGDFLVFAILFWFFLSIGIILGLKSISQFELLMFFLFILTLGTIFFVSLDYIRVENFSGFHPEKAFLPYGVILFAMSGTTAIPPLRRILRNKENELKKAIIIGTLIPLIFYIIFTFSVVGVCGSSTSPEAIKGLVEKIGDDFVLVGAVFGVMTISTSFLVLGIYLRDCLICDLGIKRFLATVFVIVVPLLALVLGVKAFVPLMAFIGIVFGAFEDVILILVFKKSKIKGDRNPEYKISLPNPILYLLCLMFTGALIYEIISFVCS